MNHPGPQQILEQLQASLDKLLRDNHYFLKKSSVIPVLRQEYKEIVNSYQSMIVFVNFVMVAVGARPAALLSFGGEVGLTSLPPDFKAKRLINILSEGFFKNVVHVKDNRGIDWIVNISLTKEYPAISYLYWFDKPGPYEERSKKALLDDRVIGKILGYLTLADFSNIQVREENLTTFSHLLSVDSTKKIPADIYSEIFDPKKVDLRKAEEIYDMKVFLTNQAFAVLGIDQEVVKLVGIRDIEPNVVLA